MNVKFFISIVVVWLIVALAPFLVFEANWGMIWFKMNQPLSLLVEQQLGIRSDSYIRIVAITVVNGLLVGSIALCVLAIVRRLLPGTSNNK